MPEPPLPRFWRLRIEGTADQLQAFLARHPTELQAVRCEAGRCRADLYATDAERITLDALGLLVVVAYDASERAEQHRRLFMDSEERGLGLPPRGLGTQLEPRP